MFFRISIQLFCIFFCIFFQPSVKSAPTKTNNKIEQMENVVYSYSNMSSNYPGDGTKTYHLTIASGPDGKLHYVTNVNGEYKEGDWEGPLPAAPDFSPFLTNINIPQQPQIKIPNLTNLSQQLNYSIHEYLKNTFANIFK